MSPDHPSVNNHSGEWLPVLWYAFAKSGRRDRDKKPASLNLSMTDLHGNKKTHYQRWTFSGISVRHIKSSTEEAEANAWFYGVTSPERLHTRQVELRSDGYVPAVIRNASPVDNLCLSAVGSQLDPSYSVCIHSKFQLPYLQIRLTSPSMALFNAYPRMWSEGIYAAVNAEVCIASDALMAPLPRMQLFSKMPALHSSSLSTAWEEMECSMWDCYLNGQWPIHRIQDEYHVHLCETCLLCWQICSEYLTT